MPLDPKQQPPYYTPGTTNPIPSLQKLFTQTAIQESDGTNITVVGEYTLPGNTLSQNGQIIKAEYWGNSYNNPTTITIYVTFMDWSVELTAFTGDKAYKIELIIMRVSNTLINYSITLNAETTSQTFQGTKGTINLQNPYDIELGLHAPTDGNIRLTGAYLTLIN